MEPIALAGVTNNECGRWWKEVYSWPGIVLQGHVLVRLVFHPARASFTSKISR